MLVETNRSSVGANQTPEDASGTLAETNEGFEETNRQSEGTNRRPVVANGPTDHTAKSSAQARERNYRLEAARDHAGDCANGKRDVKRGASVLASCDLSLLDYFDDQSRSKLSHAFDIF